MVAWDKMAARGRLLRDGKSLISMLDVQAAVKVVLQ